MLLSHVLLTGDTGSSQQNEGLSFQRVRMGGHGEEKARSVGFQVVLFHKSVNFDKTPLTIDDCLQGFNFDKVFSPSSSPPRSPPRQQQHSGASTRHFDNFPDVTTSFGSQVNTTTETGGIQAYLLVPQIDPSVPQPVVQSRGRPLLGPSPG